MTTCRCSTASCGGCGPGAPSRDLPERYGPWQTCYERWKRWDEDGTWVCLLEHLPVRDDAVGQVNWMFSIDSSIGRAHQHAAGLAGIGHQKGNLRGTIGHGDHQSAQAARAAQGLGRSRGGLTTKVHLLVNGRDLSMALLITCGNSHDWVVFEQLMAQVRVARPGGGHPRTTPEVLIGDKAYSARRIRSYLRRRRIHTMNPEPRDQRANRVCKGSRGGRPPTFDAELYKHRNVVERCSRQA